MAVQNELMPNPEKYKPTLTHAFLKLLQDKEKLSFTVTQNIDDLEKHIGVTSLSQVHGSFTRPIKCINRSCDFQTNDVKMLNYCAADVAVCHCPVCGCLLRPGVVFFGEGVNGSLTDYELRLKKCDLFITMGTSLQVGPVNVIPSLAKAAKITSILMNREKVGAFEDELSALDSIDTTVLGVCKELGWEEDLQKIYKEAQTKVIEKPVKIKQ